MSQVVTALGVLGTLAFGITTYLNYKVVKRLKENKETTIEMFFLRPQIKNGLKRLLASISIFAVSATVSIIGVQNQNIVLAQGIRVGSAILFLAYMSFFYALYRSTQFK